MREAVVVSAPGDLAVVASVVVAAVVADDIGIISSFVVSYVSMVFANNEAVVADGVGIISSLVISSVSFVVVDNAAVVAGDVGIISSFVVSSVSLVVVDNTSVVVVDVVSSVVVSEPKPSEVYLLWNYRVF